MLRATMTRPGAIEFSDVPRPKLADTEVLVRILRIGVCGSDIHVYHGKHPYTSYPVVQGHEFSAEVVETGRAVTAYSPGQKVTATPQVTCGVCPQCRSGRYNICDSLKVIGFQAPGVAQEYFAFPESWLVPLPPAFTAEMGALVEPAAVAVHAVARAGNIAGANVLVAGAGPIGNLVAQVARWRRAANIIITDISRFRLDVAEACGIPHTADANSVDVPAEVQRVFGGPADVVLECAGVGGTAGQAIRCVRKGGVIVVVGVFSEPPKVDLGLVQDRELEIRGTLMYRREDYLDAIRALAEGGLKPGPMISRTFPFRSYLKAYEYIEEHRDRVMKVLVDVEHPGD